MPKPVWGRQAVSMLDFRTADRQAEERGSIFIEIIAMRRVISLVLAFGLFVASSYFLYLLLVEAESFRIIWAVVAGTLLVASLYWIWEDVTRPPGGVTHQ